MHTEFLVFFVHNSDNPSCVCLLCYRVVDHDDNSKFQYNLIFYQLQ